MAHHDTCRISFTYAPVASMWVVALHSLFLYLTLPCHPPSDWLRLFSSQTLSRINTPTFSIPAILHTYPPMKMEQTECSETLAYKIQMPGNYPEESLLYTFSKNIQIQKFRNNPSSGSRVTSCGQTDRHDKESSYFPQFVQSA